LATQNLILTLNLPTPYACIFFSFISLNFLDVDIKVARDSAVDDGSASVVWRNSYGAYTESVFSFEICNAEASNTIFTIK
jgi:hypothetical protein